MVNLKLAVLRRGPIVEIKTSEIAELRLHRTCWGFKHTLTKSVEIVVMSPFPVRASIKSSGSRVGRLFRGSSRSEAVMAKQRQRRRESIAATAAAVAAQHTAVNASDVQGGVDPHGRPRQRDLTRERMCASSRVKSSFLGLAGGIRFTFRTFPLKEKRVERTSSLRARLELLGLGTACSMKGVRFTQTQ